MLALDVLVWLLGLLLSKLPALVDAGQCSCVRSEMILSCAADNRAHPRGHVPGDVFSSRASSVTISRGRHGILQLNENLVERCIKRLTSLEETVLDPFAGTGLTLRVCKRNENPCTVIELD